MHCKNPQVYQLAGYFNIVAFPVSRMQFRGVHDCPKQREACYLAACFRFVWFDILFGYSADFNEESSALQQHAAIETSPIGCGRP